MAKLDHIVYKNHTYASVFEGKSESKLGDHNACNLGQWYAGEGKSEFGLNSSYSAMATPHNRIHENIAKVMAIIGKNGLIDSKEIIALFKDTELASTELFEHLDNMVK